MGLRLRVCNSGLRGRQKPAALGFPRYHKVSKARYQNTFHCACIRPRSRPATSSQYERMRLFTGTSQGLRPPRQPHAAAAAAAAVAAGSNNSSAPLSMSLPATPSHSAGRGGAGAGGGGGLNGNASWWGSGSAFGSAFASLPSPSGPPQMQSPDVFAASLTSLAAANAMAAPGAPAAAAAPAVDQPAPGVGSGPPAAPVGRERAISPRPHNAHPAGPAAAAVALLATGQHTARHAHSSAQGYRLERLVALDVEQAISAAPSPKAVATLTPGSLDGMGHPVLIGADGTRIHRRINQHLPGATASRMQARGDWSFLEAAAAEAAELEGEEADDGSQDLGEGEGGFAARPHTSPMLPRMGQRLGTAGGPPGTARGGTRLRAGGGGGGGPGGAGAAQGGGGGGGGKLARSWSSPMRNRRAGGGDGGAATAAGGGMVAEASRAGRVSQKGNGLVAEASAAGRGVADGSGGGGGAAGSMRGTSSGTAPPPLAPLGADAAPVGVSGAELTSPRTTGGLLALINPVGEGPLAAPKWLGMYIPKVRARGGGMRGLRGRRGAGYAAQEEKGVCVCVSAGDYAYHMSGALRMHGSAHSYWLFSGMPHLCQPFLLPPSLTLPSPRSAPSLPPPLTGGPAGPVDRQAHEQDGGGD